MDQNLFGQIVVGAGFNAEPPSQPYRFEAAGVADIGRGWDSAETNRLNSAHWQNVSFADDINDDLQSDLQTIQRRARHESINNGMVEGAIQTHATDVVGWDSPGLQMLTDDNAFNDAVEQLWIEWSESCEHQHGLSMADLLHGFVDQWWINGEFLIQELIGRRAIDYRLHDLGAELLDVNTFGENLVMGVELDASKRVVAYHITDPDQPGKRTRLRGDYAIHAFRRRFSGQMRGIPILGSNLQTTADLRDYDDQVLDAARSAADQALWMIADHPDAQFVNVPAGTTTEVKRRVWRHAAPGWRPAQMEAKQPMVQYVDYRKERQREIGRPAQMPLLVLRQDASNHNYSSARFDAQGYWRAVMRFQAFLARRTLNKVLRRLTRLAAWEGSIPPIPARMAFQWTWPKPPAIDAAKESLAERLALENGTISYAEAVTARGSRPDQVIAQRKRDNEQLLAAGLPPIRGPLPMDPATIAAIINDELGKEPTDNNDNTDTEGAKDAANN